MSEDHSESNQLHYFAEELPESLLFFARNKGSSEWLEEAVTAEGNDQICVL